jgi:3-methyl-2-oxobutanoate hydroxymethyltransferase
MKSLSLTITDLLEMKQRGEKIVMLTAYDFPTARVCEAAGVDVILVGDSLGNTVLGYPNTIPVTMEDMLHHVKAVTRAVQRPLVVADMPFMSYQADAKEALRNAGRFLKEAGAQAVKLEGGKRVCDTVRVIVEAGIPVMGHIGYTPQSAYQFGDHIVQGKDAESADRLLEDALALQAAGGVAIVLECVPTEVSKYITRSLAIPTIGIGAGPHCDGQVLVFHDLVGWSAEGPFKFVKQYAHLNEILTKAVSDYTEDVKAERFPTDANAFHMKAEELSEWVNESTSNVIDPSTP